ncbi:hypothetical protein [Rubritalea marina]|uniref:hypothetical protein n=1 Tax=Rubritalea marina TaxID=361055 RepID=UPI0003712C92|nr:hypothetical protein [Rubritalea marina]
MKYTLSYKVLTCALASLCLVNLSSADKGGKGGGKGKPDKSWSKKGVDKKDFDKKFDHKIDKKDFKYDGDDDWQKLFSSKSDLPPGLQKKVSNGKGLPEGWKNKVKPGWAIDDDYWDKLKLLDASDLPKNFKLSEGVGAYMLGNRLLRVDKDTKKVIDFVDLVAD